MRRVPLAHTRPIPPRGSPEAGFTIIEVLVASIIVVLLGLGVATALVTQAQASGDEQLRSQAELLVNQNQDRLRGLTDQTLAGMASQGTVTRTTSVTGTSFTVASTVYTQATSGGSSCTGSIVDFHINTTVTWSSTVYGGSSRTASADSLLARPVVGILEVSVVNQLGSPLPGATVTVTPTGTTGGSAQTQSSDSNGCVVLAGLAAGTYTAAATDSGYVNQQNQSTASNNVAVTSTGTVAQTTLTLGQAGSLATTFSATANGSTYPGQADALTYAGVSSTSSPVSNSLVTPAVASHSNTLAAGQTGLTTPTSLYPWYPGSASTSSYTNNYTAYAGQCSFQNPFPSGSTTTNNATVGPGASASASIQEPFVYLGTVQGNGNAITPRDIVLSYSGGGCTDQYAATVATGTGGVNYSGVIIGQTVPANGWLADPGQPYAPSGDLTICVDVLYQGNFDYGTASVADTSLTGRNVVPAININQSGACPGITS